MEELMIEAGLIVESVEGGILKFNNGAELDLTKLIKKAKKKPEKVVSVFAFTGMRLGELEVIKETEKEIRVRKGDGKEMTFSKETGLQVDAKNARFANRIMVS